MADNFTWCGTPIANIHAWARQRGEQMVRYRLHRTILDLSGPPTTVTEEGEMPESFYDNLRYAVDGHEISKHYEELERYNP